MKELFYILSIFPIMWEMIVLYNIRRYNPYRTEEGQVIYLFMFGYFIWIFIGFFTAQWPIFMVLFLLGFFPKDRMSWQLLWIDGVVSIGLLIFTVLNAFHFHIDVWKVITG